MFKILLVLGAVIAVVKGYDLDYQHDVVINTDNYVNFIRLQNQRSEEMLDTIVQHFYQQYLGRLENIFLQLDMVADNIDNIANRYNSYDLLDNLNKYCVDKFKHLIPSSKDIRKSVNQCVVNAQIKIKSLLTDAIAIKNDLHKYYLNNFEDGIRKCDAYYNSVLNHTDCIKTVVSAANDYTLLAKKKFDNHVEVAICSANAIIKSTLECSFDIHQNVNFKTTEASLLMDRCFDRKGDDTCKPCDPEFTCSEWYETHVDTQSVSILNPVYARLDEPSCFIVHWKYK